mgnify:CR=1 FL=1
MLHEHKIISCFITDYSTTDDWLGAAEWLASRYCAKPKTIKSVFRNCGLPPSTGYALVAIGRRARACSPGERDRLRRVGASKARIIARADNIPLACLLDLAERLSARELARRLSADVSTNSQSLS